MPFALVPKPLQDVWATLAGAERVDHPLTRKRQVIKPTTERNKIMGLFNNLMSKIFGHATPRPLPLHHKLQQLQPQVARHKQAELLRPHQLQLPRLRSWMSLLCSATWPGKIQRSWIGGAPLLT